MKLVGTKANRAAIGARIQVTVDTPHGRRDILRTVSSGGSFGSNPLRQEIGLGDATAIAAVKVTWPGSGQVQDVPGVKLDRFYEIKEGRFSAYEFELKPFRLEPRNAIARGHSGKGAP